MTPQLKYKIVHNYVVNYCRNRNVIYLGVTDDNGLILPSAEETAKVSKSWIGVDNKLIPNKKTLNILTIDLNVNTIKFRPNIDLIVATEILEHLEKPVETLRLIGYNFPDCELLASVPNALSFGRILLAIFSKNIYKNQDKSHLMNFTNITIQNLLTAAKMNDIRIVPYNTRPILNMLLKNWPSLASGFIIHARFPQRINK